MSTPDAVLRHGIDTEQVNWLVEATRRQLLGCRVQGHDGLWLHTPDGVGNYKALWTRDFQYMVEHAGDLLDPQEIRASILYLLRGQRADGCVPDRVNVEGQAIYSPGGEQAPLADHALDNGPFLAMLVCNYLDLTDDAGLFSQVEPAVRMGLDHTRRDDSGLVYTSGKEPQCPYGFTDTVAKSGHLLFCSVLYHWACQRMARASRMVGTGDAGEYQHRADLIAAHLDVLWDDDQGMFLAADEDCRQTDIWGSALAAHLGCATTRQSARVSAWLVEHYDSIVQSGQVRHLPAGQTWQRFFSERGVEEGTYQNGAFWATPLAWVVPTIANCDRELAIDTVKVVIGDFRTRGIAECVNADYRKVSDYVVSATSVYSLLRDSSRP